MSTPTENALEYRARLGLWVFLASELMFFGPVFVSYAVASYTLAPGFGLAGQTTDLLLGTLNTVILLSSSLFVALAVEFSRQGRTQTVRRMLTITIALAIAFLVVKAREYGQDWDKNLVPGYAFSAPPEYHQRSTELFYYIYFVSTLLHGVHLLIGIGLLAISRHRISASPVYHRRLAATALYWHFVDLIWIFLFPLLYLAGRSS